MNSENIKIISSKIDRETKEGKIVIEVEEVPQTIKDKIKQESSWYMAEIPETLDDAIRDGIRMAEYGYQLAKEESHEFEWTEELVIMYAEAYRYSSSRISIKQFKEILSTDNKWHTTLRASAKEIFEIWAAKEIPDEVVYRTVKASDRKPNDKKVRFAFDEKGVKYSAFYVRDHQYEIEFDDDKLPDYIYADEKRGILTLKEGWYEECENVGEYEYIIYPRSIFEWLEPIQLKDLLAK